MKSIILLIVFLVILFSYLFYINHYKKKLSEESKQKILTPEEEKAAARKKAIESGECCGQHAVCEKETLINTKLKAEYYDDEELDQFKHRDSSSYTAEETKLFENVFYTLKEYDINGWMKSMQIREINVPDSIKEEALFILQERRFKK